MKEKIYIVVFCMLLIVPHGINIMLKDNENMENKSEADFPKFENSVSSFIQGINAYINDRIPLKNSAVKLIGKIEKFSGTEYETDKGILGQGDWMFYKGDDGISSVNDYLGITSPKDEKLRNIRDSLINLDETLKKREVNLYVVICPNKEDVIGKYLPKKYHKRENVKTYSDAVFTYLQSEMNNVIYPVNLLKKYDSFYKYDTHWNEIGAYLTVTEFEKLAGISSLPIDDVKIIKSQKDGGDMFSILQLDANDYNKDIYYKMQTGKGVVTKESQSVPTKNSIPFQTYTTSSYNKQHLYVIGDSFSTSMAPYLQEDYKEVTILHRGDIDLLNTREIKHGDTIMIQIASRYSSSLDVVATEINKIIKGD